METNSEPFLTNKQSSPSRLRIYHCSSLQLKARRPHEQVRAHCMWKLDY